MVSKPCVAMALAAGLMATCFSAPAALAADLKIGIAGSPTSMDPQFYVIGTNSAMARNIFDGLVNQDDRQWASIASGSDRMQTPIQKEGADQPDHCQHIHFTGVAVKGDRPSRMSDPQPEDHQPEDGSIKVV